MGSQSLRGPKTAVTKNTTNGQNASQAEGDDAAKEMFFDDRGQFTGFDNQIDELLVR
jgi:hypothetical protein